MTVRALIERLQQYDPERQVILQRDAEGNGFSPLLSAYEAAYRAESTYHGEVGLERLTEEDRAEGYTHEDVITGGVKALVLRPIN